MSSRHFTTGVVLNKIDYRENDQIFDVYTREFGKIKILGKSIRKIKSKLRYGVGSLTLSEIEFIEGKTQKILIDSSCLKKYKEIYFDLIKLKFSYAVADIVNQLAHYEEKDEIIFNLIEETIERINNCEEKDKNTKEKFLKMVYFFFLWKLLSHLGYQINLFDCSLCNGRLTPHELSFNNENTGILCMDCRDEGGFNKVYILPETIKIIRLILSKEWDFVSKLVVGESHLNDISKFSASYLSYVRGTTNSCQQRAYL